MSIKNDHDDVLEIQFIQII